MKEKRLLIIAGAGILPLYVAQAARLNNDEPVIVLILDKNDIDWTGFEVYHLEIGNFRALRALINKLGVSRVVISGAVHHRPEFQDLRLTWRSLFRLPKIISQLTSAGDAAILKTVIGLIESSSVRVIGAHDIVPDLLAKAGSLGIHAPDVEARGDISSAMQAADVLCKLDVGQAAVSVGGRVVALEGADGTDAMLERVASLKASNRISSYNRGVLVKMCKPQQGIRVDLPSIGIVTIKNAIKAGISGIAVEVGKSFILERDALISIAGEAGLFVYGIDRGLEEGSL